MSDEDEGALKRAEKRHFQLVAIHLVATEGIEACSVRDGDLYDSPTLRAVKALVIERDELRRRLAACGGDA